MATAYTVLGVERSASEADIAAAFRAKALEHHPDRGGAPAKMALINRAWEKLRNAEARAAYDAHLQGLEREQAREPAAEQSTDGADWLDRLRAASLEGLDLEAMLGADKPELARVQAAAQKTADVCRGAAELISLVRGQ